MGNIQIPNISAPAISFTSLTTALFNGRAVIIDLSNFKNLPIEIQLYILSFVPLKDLPNILLISKHFYNEIMNQDEMFIIYYQNFRKQVEKEIFFNEFLENPHLLELPIKLDINRKRHFVQTGYNELQKMVTLVVKERKYRKNILDMLNNLPSTHMSTMDQVMTCSTEQFDS